LKVNQDLLKNIRTGLPIEINGLNYRLSVIKHILGHIMVKMEKDLETFPMIKQVDNYQCGGQLLNVEIPWITTNLSNVIKGEPIFKMRTITIDMHLYRTIMLRLM